MKLTSKADNTLIINIFGCMGKNLKIRYKKKAKTDNFDSSANNILARRLLATLFFITTSNTLLET